MIELEQFFPDGVEVSDEIRSNAGVLLHRVNLLLMAYRDSGNPLDESLVHTGWLANAAQAKRRDMSGPNLHGNGMAIDVSDIHGAMDEWLMANQHILGQRELWMEHPAGTRGFCRLQMVPPVGVRRGRVFFA